MHSLLVLYLSLGLGLQILLVSDTRVKSWQLQNLTVRILKLIGILGGLNCGLHKIVVIFKLFSQVTSFQLIIKYFLAWCIRTHPQIRFLSFLANLSDCNQSLSLILVGFILIILTAIFDNDLVIINFCFNVNRKTWQTLLNH